MITVSACCLCGAEEESHYEHEYAEHERHHHRHVPKRGLREGVVQHHHPREGEVGVGVLLPELRLESADVLDDGRQLSG